MLQRGTGYIVDTPDFRDHKFDSLGLCGLRRDRGSVAQFVRVVHNQSWTKSCVIQAMETAYGTRRAAVGDPYDPFSRRYVWFNALSASGKRYKNEGCQPRVALRMFQKLGGSLESTCPFSVSPLAMLRSPKWAAFADGYKKRTG